MNLNFYIEKKYFSRRLEYISRVIARRLGFPYRFIVSADKIGEDEITISYLPPEDYDDNLPGSGLNVFNSQKISDLDAAEKSVTLFEWKNDSIPLIGPQMVPEGKGWKLDPKGAFYKKNRSDHWLLPCDIFLNTFYHLSRYEEKWRHFTEETATDYSSSILSRYEKLNVPVVDVLISYLDETIQKRIKSDKKVAVRVQPWPDGEDMGVALTHDVDITRGVHLQERILRKSQGFIYHLMGNDTGVREINESIKERDDKAWSFPELLSSYESMNYKATFFFLAKMLEGSHVRYNISSGKFKKLFGDLKSAGHEIALHPSKFAFDKPKYYKDEKDSLESATGGMVGGMRQHYLRAKFPRLWSLAEKAGLIYDSSLGYNYQAGFRAGTTHPFQTYDLLGDTPLSLTEFPLNLFEYNLPDRGNDIPGSKMTIDNLTETVAGYGGLFVVLLHPSNLQKEPFKHLWEYVLDKIQNKKIFVATLSEHLIWRRKRDRIKIRFNTKNGGGKTLQISLPDGINRLAIEIFGAKPGDTSKNVIIRKQKKKSYTIRSHNKNITIPLEIEG